MRDYPSHIAELFRRADRSLWWYRWASIGGLVFDLASGCWDYSTGTHFGVAFQFFLGGFQFAMTVHSWFLLKTSKEDENGSFR